MIIKTGNETPTVIVGLGNPGAEYAKTRHNAGFRVIDILTVKLKASMPKEKFDGLIFTAQMGEKKVLLVKPQTYMNESGVCIRQIASFYKIPNEKIAVIYDDIDLPEGKVRIRAKGSAGTHNGMRSAVKMLSGENFPRIRVGVGQPPNKDYDLADYVLGKFPKESEETMEKAFCLAAEAAEEFIAEGIDSAMCKYNKSR